MNVDQVILGRVPSYYSFAEAHNSVVMKAHDPEKHGELRQKVDEMERKSEHFLRRM